MRKMLDFGYTQLSAAGDLARLRGGTGYRAVNGLRLTEIVDKAPGPIWASYDVASYLAMGKT